MSLVLNTVTRLHITDETAFHIKPSPSEMYESNYSYSIIIIIMSHYQHGYF